MAPNPHDCTSTPLSWLCFPWDCFFSQRDSSCLFGYLYEMIFSLGGWEVKSQPPVPGGRDPLGPSAWSRAPSGHPAATPLSQHPRPTGTLFPTPPRAFFSLPFGLRKPNEPTQQNPKETGMKNHHNPL